MTPLCSHIRSDICSWRIILTISTLSWLEFLGTSITPNCSHILSEVRFLGTILTAATRSKRVCSTVRCKFRSWLAASIHFDDLAVFTNYFRNWLLRECLNFRDTFFPNLWMRLVHHTLDSLLLYSFTRDRPHRLLSEVEVHLAQQYAVVLVHAGPLSPPRRSLAGTEAHVQHARRFGVSLVHTC